MILTALTFAMLHLILTMLKSALPVLDPTMTKSNPTIAMLDLTMPLLDATMTKSDPTMPLLEVTMPLLKQKTNYD